MEILSASDRPKRDIKWLKAEFMVKYITNFDFGEQDPTDSSKYVKPDSR